MALALLPQPKVVREARGYFALPPRMTIGIGDQSAAPVALHVCQLLNPAASIAVSVPEVEDTVTVRTDATCKPQGYRLRVEPKRITLEGACHAGLMYGYETLQQIVAQGTRNKVPLVTIEDWPDLPVRGVYYDVCRGRVPELEYILQQVDTLASFKINQFQLYIEHTFKFRRHPAIGKGASPLTPADILVLDAYCTSRQVELVPSLASFGHLATVLKHPQYRHLAEDWGINKYVDPEAKNHPYIKRLQAFCLSPANPAIYEFLDELFGEFLPLFSSKQFNVTCDETWTLGAGQSYELCQKRGKGRVYLDHILKLRDLAAKYGKRIMFWGDIIRNHPELIGEIPSDVTVLDWGYDFNHPFDALKDFKKAGVPFYACPGTSSWVSLFPRLHDSRANIAGFAAAAKKHGANGLLNTDWGDGGHFNFMEYSWYGYLFGAEQAWNTDADQSTFTSRFCKLFLERDDPKLVRAIEDLGDVTQTRVLPYYQSIWKHVYFAVPGDEVFTCGGGNGFMAKRGKIEETAIRLDAALGAKTLEQLDKIRRVFAAHNRAASGDFMGVLPYWIFAADTLRHAARKLAAFGPGGRDTPAVRKSLKAEMESLWERFEELWMERNRVSEIRITRKQYDRVLRAL